MKVVSPLSGERIRLMTCRLYPDCKVLVRRPILLRLLPLLQLVLLVMLTGRCSRTDRIMRIPNTPPQHQRGKLRQSPPIVGAGPMHIKIWKV